ncbi:MAG: Crp/Fnr family transcriptional regulator [Clostridia bacterium]|nr:Crp/Fnr family transcriptional regulator [Clostridia bacterium]
MEQNEVISVLSRCPLFRSVEKEVLSSLLSTDGVRTCVYSHGEEIPLASGNEHLLVILTRGTALAYSLDKERSVILRTVTPGTAFGVSVLFSEEAPVSVIRAKTSAEAVAIPSSVVRSLIAESPTFRMNYIEFLSGRIRFLNRRIACYTAGSAERRLALYLVDLPEAADGVAVLDVPMTDLSELLDIGRASLYRAFGRLSECGLIRREDRRVEILDRDGLLRYGADGYPEARAQTQKSNTL